MKNEYFLPISFDFFIFYVILPHDETNMKNEKKPHPQRPKTHPNPPCEGGSSHPDGYSLPLGGAGGVHTPSLTGRVGEGPT